MQTIDVKRVIAACVITLFVFGYFVDNQYNDMLNEYKARQIEYENKQEESFKQIAKLEENLNTAISESAKLKELLEESEKEKEAIKKRMSRLSSYKMVEAVVAAESQGEPEEGVMAVAQSIVDRSTSSGKSILQVITAPNQYAPPNYQKVDDSVKIAVARVLQDGERVFPDGVWSFHSEKVDPGWSETRVCRGQIGGHLFYGGAIKK